MMSETRICADAATTVTAITMTVMIIATAIVNSNDDKQTDDKTTEKYSLKHGRLSFPAARHALQIRPYESRVAIGGKHGLPQHE